MARYDDETLRDVKSVDLLSYLERAAPGELVRTGAGAYRTRTHGSLKISGGKWYWWGRGIGGRSAIDYLIKVEGLPFRDAVARIIDTGFVNPIACPQPKAEQKKTLILPPRHASDEAVRLYLERRGISPDIYAPLMEEGRIYESRYRFADTGREISNAVFVGADENGVPRYAQIRGIGRDYKGDAEGSDKRYSFSVPTASSLLCVFESAIDLLSYSEIMRCACPGIEPKHLLSLAGVNRPGQKSGEKIPLALGHYLSKHPEIRTIGLCLDADGAGRLASESISKALSGEYSVADNPPPAGKDYNDFLRLTVPPILKGGSRARDTEYIR